MTIEFKVQYTHPNHGDREAIVTAEAKGYTACFVKAAREAAKGATYGDELMSVEFFQRLS